MLGFKPQALNYSAQAEMALRRLAPLAVANGNADESEIMIWLADQIRDAVHFVMPEDGRVFDDKFKGIKGSEARLPFPRVTLEYYSNRDPGVSTEGSPLYKATRRVLLAMELTAEELLGLAQRFFKRVTLPAVYTNKICSAFPDGVIFVTGLFYIEGFEIPDGGTPWSPCYAAWLLPVKGWDNFNRESVILPLREYDPNATGIAGRPLPIFWRAWMDMVDNMGQEMTDRYTANDIGVEAFCVLELIEALNCRNVRISTLQSVKPNVNARRVRDGKLPLYETKILTVDVSPRKPGAPRGPLEESRASPGEHLRCGHSQRYITKDGPIWLWKQDIVVAIGNPRVIKKSYKIKKV